MSVASATASQTFTGLGATGPYAITFPVEQDSAGDAQNIKCDVVDASGNITENVSITVSGLNVTTGTAYAATYTLVIYRDSPATQQLDLVNNSNLNADTLEQQGLDRLVHIVAELKAELALCIKVPRYESSPSTRLGDLTANKELFLYLNASEEFVLAAQTAGSETISAFAATVLDDAGADAIMATLIAGFTGSLDADGFIAALIAAGDPLNIKGSLELYNGSANADRNIGFASDADLLWDESEDWFDLNKPLISPAFPLPDAPDLSLSASPTASYGALYCHDLTITADVTLHASMIVVEGDLTIDATFTLTIGNGIQQTIGISSFTLGDSTAFHGGVFPFPGGSVSGNSRGGYGGGKGGGSGDAGAGGFGGDGGDKGGSANSGGRKGLDQFRTSTSSIVGDGGAGGTTGTGPGGGGGLGGSGGGTGGAGGAVVIIVVKGNVLNSGTIAADGTAGGTGDPLGGGGGGGGGVFLVAHGAAPTVGTITAKGAAGGNSSGSNGGGGGGGGGGYVAVWSKGGSGTLTVTGGAAGTGNGSGDNGSAGSAGQSHSIDISTSPEYSLMGGVATTDMHQLLPLVGAINALGVKI